jgi:hypothetical protein
VFWLQVVGVNVEICCRGRFAIIFWIVCFRNKIIVNGTGEDSLAKASFS